MRIGERKLSFFFLFRFLLPYILFILVFMSVASFIYARTLTVIEEEVTRNNMAILEQSQKILSNRLVEIEMLGHKLNQDPKVIRFQYTRDPMKGPNIIQVMETVKRLKEYELSNVFLSDYYVLYDMNDMVIGNENVYTMTEFYQSILRYRDMDYEAWRRLMLNEHHYHKYISAEAVQYKGNNTSMVTYVRSLGYPGYFYGVAMILIQEKEIQELLGELDISNGGWTYIAAPDGQVITSRSEALVDVRQIDLSNRPEKGVIVQKMDGENMMVTYSKSPDNGWMFVAVQPEQTVLNKANYIKKTSLHLFIGSIIVVFLLAIVFAYRTSKPLQGLIGGISDYFRVDSFEFPKLRHIFNHSVSKILNNYDSLLQKAKSQFPLLEVVLFDQILKGEIADEQTIQTHIQYMGLAISGGDFAVAILQLPEHNDRISADLLDERSVRKVLIQETLERQFADRYFLHDKGDEQFVLLFMCEPDHRAQREQIPLQQLRTFRHFLNTEYQIDLRIAMGSFVGQWTEVARSYEEAKQVIVYLKRHEHQTVASIDTLPDRNRQYVYPADMEMRLVNLTNAGEREQVESILEKIRMSNFQQGHLSLYMLRLFLFEFWGSLVKLKDQASWSDDPQFAYIDTLIKHVDSYEEIERAFHKIHMAYLQVCDFVQSRKKSHNIQLLQQVKARIQASFHLEAFTLGNVAAELRVSEVYLSLFFKEQTGETFSAYLERIRMEKAVELLLTTNASVQHIAKRSGYSSSNTFGRAFKRNYGMSANQYRQSKK